MRNKNLGNICYVAFFGGALVTRNIKWGAPATARLAHAIDHLCSSALCTQLLPTDRKIGHVCTQKHNRDNLFSSTALNLSLAGFQKSFANILNSSCTNFHSSCIFSLWLAIKVSDCHQRSWPGMNQNIGQFWYYLLFRSQQLKKNFTWTTWKKNLINQPKTKVEGGADRIKSESATSEHNC